MHGRRREAVPGGAGEQHVAVAVRLAEAAQDLQRRARHDRVQGQRDEAQAGRQAVQHRVEAARLRLVLGQLPGRLLLDQTVEAAHELPHRLERRRDLHGVQVRRTGGHHRLAGGRHGGEPVACRTASAAPPPAAPADRAAAVLGDHGDGAAHQVAQLVGELAVVAALEALERDDPVLAERDLAEQVVAQGVDAVGLHHRERVEHVAARLAHLLAAHEQEAVDELALGQLVAGAHEHRRPDDGVELEDVLGHQVHRRRPVAGEVLAGAGVRQRREVVDERVDPDVDDLLRVPRHGDAPLERRAADGDVLQALLDEGERLVVARLRPDPLGVGAEEGARAGPDRRRA